MKTTETNYFYFTLKKSELIWEVKRVKFGVVLFQVINIADLTAKCLCL